MPSRLCEVAALCFHVVRLERLNTCERIAGQLVNFRLQMCDEMPNG